MGNDYSWLQVASDGCRCSSSLWTLWTLPGRRRGVGAVSEVKDGVGVVTHDVGKLSGRL